MKRLLQHLTTIIKYKIVNKLFMITLDKAAMKVRILVITSKQTYLIALNLLISG